MLIIDPTVENAMPRPSSGLTKSRNLFSEVWNSSLSEKALKQAGLALPWTRLMPSKLNGSHIQGSNELISRFIYELKSEIRNRKQISSHIQHNKTIGSHMSRLPTKLTQQIIETATALREADFGNTSFVDRHIGCIQNAANVLAR